MVKCGGGAGVRLQAAFCLIGDSDVLEMGVFEGGRILKAEAKHAVRTDVRKPVQGVRQEE
jgi:hypothetical protein